MLFTLDKKKTSSRYNEADILKVLLYKGNYKRYEGLQRWMGGKACWTGEVQGTRGLRAGGLIHLDFDVTKDSGGSRDGEEAKIVKE